MFSMLCDSFFVFLDTFFHRVNKIFIPLGWVYVQKSRLYW